MTVDFDKMESHVLELMEMCSIHLNNILKKFSNKEIKVSHKFSLDTSVNASSSLKESCYSVSLNNGAYVAVQKFYQEKFLDRDKSYYFSLSKDIAAVKTVYCRNVFNIALKSFHSIRIGF